MACCLFYAAASRYGKHARQDLSIYQAYPFKPCTLFLSIFAGR